MKAVWAITFYDRPASDAQIFIAPPKRQFLEKRNQPLDKIFVQKFFQRRKMKACKSPETRFPKDSRPSESCSGGKRPFEVSKKNRNSRVSVRKGNVAQELHRFGAVLVLRYRLHADKWNPRIVWDKPLEHRLLFVCIARMHISIKSQTPLPKAKRK